MNDTIEQNSTVLPINQQVVNHMQSTCICIPILKEAYLLSDRTICVKLKENYKHEVTTCYRSTFNRGSGTPHKLLPPFVHEKKSIDREHVKNKITPLS